MRRKWLGKPSIHGTIIIHPIITNYPQKIRKEIDLLYQSNEGIWPLKPLPLAAYYQLIFYSRGGVLLGWLFTPIGQELPPHPMIIVPSIIFATFVCTFIPSLHHLPNSNKRPFVSKSKTAWKNMFNQPSTTFRPLPHSLPVPSLTTISGWSYIMSSNHYYPLTTLPKMLQGEVRTWRKPLIAGGWPLSFPSL